MAATSTGHRASAVGRGHHARMEGMENERQERKEGHTDTRRGGASTEGIAAAMVRPDGSGLPHWGGRRPPRSTPVDVAGGKLPGRANLPEKDR